MKSWRHPLGRNLLGTGGVFMLALLLAGCARFEPRPLEPAATARQLEARSLTNVAVKAFLETNLHRAFPSWPPEKWDFEMLSLAAFYFHPSLDVARAEWAVARGGETTAAQRPNPTLNVTPGYDATTAIPSPWIPLGYLDVPIETAGKRGYRRAEAAHLSEAARLNIATVAWQVRHDVRSSLLDWQAATRRESALKEQVALQQQVVNLLEGQVKAGSLAPAEAVTFRIALQKSRLDFADAERQLAESRASLAQAIGLPLSALDGIPLAPADWRPVSPELTSREARRFALQSRADVLGALANYAASQSELQLQIAKQYPDVRLEPGYEFDQGDSKWTLGLTVDLPVFNQNQGPIAEAKARRQEAAARFLALQAKVMAEVDHAIEVLNVAARTTATLQAVTTEQAARRASIEAQLRAGAAEPLDLLNARFEYLSAELAEMDGELKLQQAAGALEDSIQRPFDSLKTVFTSQRTDAP